MLSPVDSPDGIHLLFSPKPITSSLDQRNALELHMTLPLPNDIYIVDGREQERFILHSFDLSSDNDIKTGIRVSASGQQCWNILQETVKIGQHLLLKGALNNTIKHLLPGTIQTIHLNWLILRYNHSTKRYETEDIPVDNDSQFSLKLIFVKQE